MPAGSLFEIQYDEEGLDLNTAHYPTDPRQALVGDARNTGLVELRTATLPIDVEFLRFTTEYLPPVIRNLAGQCGADQIEVKHPHDTIRSYLPQAYNLTNEELGRRVTAVLARDRAVRL